MPRTETTIDSSNLLRIEYESKSRELLVQFQNGRVYRYVGVHPNTVRGLMNAKSKGKYFQRLMRFNYDYHEL